MDSKITDIWHSYEKGLDYFNSKSLLTRVETCHNYVNGDQWKGLKSGTERPPQLNILLPMMKSATALVGQNTMEIQYTSLNYSSGRERLLDVCEFLNIQAKRNWERLKLDKIMWEVLQDAYIGGDSFLYFYDDDSASDGRVLGEIIDTTNIMFSDEQERDIQKQSYVLIVQRLNIKSVKAMAKREKVTSEDFKLILPDDDTQLQINGDNEVKNDSKITLISKFYKKDGFVYVEKATKSVVIKKTTKLPIKSYPIAKYTWKPRKGLARGDGDIWDKIPNQQSINKSLYRLEQAVKSSAYPVRVYRENSIDKGQVALLDNPGASIGVKGNSDTNIQNIIGFLQPAQISSYASTYWQNLITLTRELSGSGDNLENIDPEKASGTSIQAVRDAKTLSVNMQVANYKQFVEDIANIWYEMLVGYNPFGVVIYTDEGKKEITCQELDGLMVDIKVDMTPSDNAYRALKDYYLKEALSNGFISFEEYVSALGANTAMPKSEFEKIVEKRKPLQDEINSTQAMEIGGGNIEMQGM